MSTGYPLDVDRVLQQKTVRDAPSRALFLAAMREFGKEGGDFTLERLRQFMQVEEHFQALLNYDQLEFLHQSPESAEGDRDFALNVQRICLESANGLQRYLRTRSQWADSKEALEVMFRVTSLALHAIHSYVKWGYFLAEPGRSTPWRQLHALYSLAESDGFSQVPVVLHPSQPAFRPSAQALYLRTLLLDALNSGNLSKVQIEIADGWFSSWCSDYALESEYSSRKHLFYVDLASDSGLHIMRRDSHGESMRYVRADGLRAQIEEVQAGLRQGKLYAGYGAGAVFPVEEHVALLAMIEKLYHSILAGSENRVEERTHFEDREVDVAIGVELVMRKSRELNVADGPESGAVTPAPASASDTIELSAEGLSLVPNAPAPEAPADDPELSRWRVLDLSSNGFGLLVDRATSDNVLLNGLLALQNHETGGWILGHVVRKLPNRVRGEMLLGVEVLAYKSMPVELQEADGTGSVEAIYLPGLDQNGKQDSMIIRTQDFSADKTFTLYTAGGMFRLKLNHIVRKGADWIKIRFEIVSRA
ncbi:hypothetical protein [Usitatibacter palustris]|uniref:PilZ domain-containing protein n=1 Tax=Usitatibacter palustris TaxID=2732487 RepID=A0A6M4H736_9PROT|nr:hypothetical protein [Usitatibacter palustris]QJR14493.1 hypothetical protein DSM104440_01294 [Usitatibacter palustris]